MKKVLVFLIGFLLISCSHEFTTYSEQEIKEIIQNNYDRSFTKAYGQVGENVDWGFSSKNTMTRSISDYTGYKGNMQPNISWPSDCDASMFNPDLTGVKSYDDYCKTLGNANWTPDEFGYGEVYIDKVQKIHIWGEYGKRVKLYIKEGTYDFRNETFDLCADADLYLLPGAIVTFGNDAANTTKFDVYIAPGAKLIANGVNGFRADVDAHVYNHGTIECTRFEINGTSFLYNVGELNVPNGDVYIANSESRIVNDGTIDAASTHVEGSGALQNNAEWTVTGNTVVNCNAGGWVNNGHWITQNYHYTAGSNNVINNCLLKVTNEFNINMSSASAENGFKIDSNGGVETRYFNGGKCSKEIDNSTEDKFSGPYKVIMGNKSLFKVTETATLEGGNKGWGFFGPTDGEYAVFQAKDIKRNPKHEGTQGAVTYGGNLYVSAETHFVQGNDGNPNNLFIYEEGGFNVNTNIFAGGFNPGKPNITIEETPCNPGFGGEVYRVIAEDLSAAEAGDFDFNDVVFDVLGVNNNKTTLKLICAGGTLPLKVMGIEVHGLFGDTAPELSNHPMYNTGAGPKVNPVTFEVEGEYITPEDINNITIEVYKNNMWIELTATRGKAACKILVNSSFIPVRERQNIADENLNFTNYVQGQFVSNFWWN